VKAFLDRVIFLRGVDKKIRCGPNFVLILNEGLDKKPGRSARGETLFEMRLLKKQW
jgi:hypothetical protein